jgi:hypothetical protein
LLDVVALRIDRFLSLMADRISLHDTTHGNAMEMGVCCI